MSDQTPAQNAMRKALGDAYTKIGAISGSRSARFSALATIRAALLRELDQYSYAIQTRDEENVVPVPPKPWHTVTVIDGRPRTIRVQEGTKMRDALSQNSIYVRNGHSFALQIGSEVKLVTLEESISYCICCPCTITVLR